MENFKWEKSDEIELPKNSSRATPLSENDLFLMQSRGKVEDDPKKILAKHITEYHVNEERRKTDRRIHKEIEPNNGGIVSSVQEGEDAHKELDVLKKEEARLEAQLMEEYNKFGNKSKIDDLEAKLNGIADKIKGISVPTKSPIERGEEYVTVNKGVVKQVKPTRLINVSMKDFEGAPADRNSTEKKATKELSDAREKFAFADEEKDPQEYARISEEYRLKVEKEKDFIIKHKKSTLEKKGLLDKKTGTYKKLTAEESQYELDKYIKANIVPHFAVVEAAKIQEARNEPSFIEKMKDSKWGSLATTVIDGYRKMSWKKKLLVSASLFGVGVTAGAVGGTFGFAVAGIVTGGKGIQRLFSGAGTAVGLDALMQKSQQKWMLKEGWGKDRHEYVSKQIALMREKMKNGDVVDKDIEEQLKEREEVEKGNEMRRTGIAAIAGVLVGSGAAFRVADEYLGISDKLHTAGDYWGISDKLKHLFGGEVKVPTEHHMATTGTPPVAETVAHIKPIELTIGTRGPEGAIIDEVRRNPELARKLGWAGDNEEDFSKWVGAKAHTLWGESAKQALLDPSIKQELAKLGYPETTEGYEKAMTRIGKGVVSLDIDKGSIKLDAEYLKNIISSPAHPSINIFHEELVQSPGATVNYTVGGVPQTPIHETLLSQHQPAIEPASPPIYFAEIQKQMDLPEGKLRGLLANSWVRGEGLEDFLKRQGGIEKLLKMQVRDLYGIEQGYPRPVQLDRLYEGLKGITGDARLESNDTLEDVLKSIESKKIFHGTAEDILLKGEIPTHSDITHEITNPEKFPDSIKQGKMVVDAQIDESTKDTAPSPGTSTNIPHEELAKTSDTTKEIGQVSSNEVVTSTGVKGVFNYDTNGKIVGVGVEGSESILKGKALLNDNYHEIIMKKGGNIANFRTVDVLAQQIYQQQQILKTLEGSGQGGSDKAEFLRKTIKGATDQVENKYGKVFK